MLKYEIKAEIREHGEAYGLTVIFEDGSRKCYSDLTRDREGIEAFVNKINRGSVSSVHLDELIEDFIG